MKGDFSKMTFAPDKNFLRVLMQQGRVQLDADWNEQAAILLHYMQTLAVDLIGPYAGPADNLGFAVNKAENNNGDFSIGKGRYYVDGVLCENHHDHVTYLTQPDYQPAMLSTRPSGKYVVYLDVWERHISYLEDDDIREKALNGADTATRSKVIWQVKVKSIENDDWSHVVSAIKDEVVLSEACLSVQVKPDDAEPNACCQRPDAKYRGTENQLYRIEIHSVSNDKTAFKWSRENGSVVFPVTAIAADAEAKTMTVTLETLGRDDNSMAVNDWMELVDDDSVLENTANPLCQVYAIDRMARTVILTGASSILYDKSKHPLLRRWDQKGNADDVTDGIPVQFESWLPIEAGIEVKFELHGNQSLRTGDYWLIPVRTSTGDVEWPTKIDSNGNVIPAAMRPHGVEHRYAPLAIIGVDTSGNVSIMASADYRCRFRPLSYSCQYSYYGRLGQGIGTDLLCLDNEK